MVRSQDMPIFWYPKKFGYGELWIRMAEKINDNIEYNKTIDKMIIVIIQLKVTMVRNIRQILSFLLFHGWSLMKYWECLLKLKISLKS